MSIAVTGWAAVPMSPSRFRMRSSPKRSNDSGIFSELCACQWRKRRDLTSHFGACHHARPKGDTNRIAIGKGSVASLRPGCLPPNPPQRYHYAKTQMKTAFGFTAARTAIGCSIATTTRSSCVGQDNVPTWSVGTRGGSLPMRQFLHQRLAVIELPQGFQNAPRMD